MQSTIKSEIVFVKLQRLDYVIFIEYLAAQGGIDAAGSI